MLPMRSIRALCCLALLGALAVHACTSGGYLDPKHGYMSWRLLDLPTSYFNSMAWVPSGTQMQLLPVSGRNYSDLGATTRVKYSFVCQTSSENVIRALLQAADPGLKVDMDVWPGGCSDGMNTKGLHVSSQMQDNSTGVSRYSGSGPAVEQIDLVNYLLANYKDVQSIWNDLESRNLTVVLNPNFEIITKVFFQTNFATLHYNIRDNTGRSMVIQYSGPNNLQWFDSTKYWGALANNPLWLDQVAYYENWWATQADPYITIHDSKFLNLAGSFNSSHRFLRAAKLPEAGYIWEWPENIEVSPRYVVDGQPRTNPALIAVTDILSSVYLPKGVDDSGGRQYEGGNKHRDIVWFTFIADHPEGAYYYRVANTPLWRRIKLDEVDWRSMRGCIKYMKMFGSTWWADDSNSWARTRRETERRHSAPPMTMAALTADIELYKKMN